MRRGAYRDGPLDAMHKLARLASGGNEVVPAAGDVGLGIEAEDMRRDGIAVMVIVEEPAVERGFAQSSLDGVEIVHEIRIRRVPHRSAR